MDRGGRLAEPPIATDRQIDRTEYRIECMSIDVAVLLLLLWVDTMRKNPFEPFLVTRTYRVFSWEFVCYAEMCIVNAGATLIIIIRYVERLLSDSSSLSRRLL